MKQWSPPHIGQRMIKTGVAVFLCLAFYCFLGYRGADMPTEAAITAIICMQPYVRDSREYALNRLEGTLIGAVWGLLFLLIPVFIPALETHLYLLYAIMAAGVLVCLYTAVAIRKPDVSSLSAIVFICIVIAFPEIEDPLYRAFQRIVGLMIGTVAAVGVNVFRLPRSRDRSRVFFLRAGDLVPDRFAQISPAVLFRLNTLNQDGAKICLISRHAPAFFISQISSLTLNLPMIVMDGAALYDVNENRYVRIEPLPVKSSAQLIARLERMGLSFFLYTVHRNRTCIFHRGALSESEGRLLNQMRRTPYRSYLNEEVYAQEELVYIKLIGEDAAMRALYNRLQTYCQCRGLRASVRPQAGVSGVSGLYIYARKATVPQAEAHLMELLERQEPGLRARELFAPAGYRSEHDAMHLLYRVLNLYEPLLFLPRRRGKS